MNKGMQKISVKYVRGWEKVQGLIGKKITPISFSTRYGIHTFGMQKPIDVLVLDKHNTVVAMYNQLKPNRIFFWNPRYTRIIELPEGTIQQKKIHKGEFIMLSPLA
jgi:uncharacterized membrane protein (UPF0127 family)